MSEPGWRQPANPLAGGRRLARAGALGLASYGLAVGAHLTGGGALPGLPLGVVLTALLGVLGVACTARRLRLPALVAALAVSQAALHVLLSLAEAPTTPCSAGAVSHHAVVAMCGPPEVASGSMLMPSLPMLLAHTGAVLATAWVLARGEAWLWRTLRRAFSLPVPPPLQVTSRAAVIGRDARGLATRWIRPDAPRGPPTAALLPAS